MKLELSMEEFKDLCEKKGIFIDRIESNHILANQKIFLNHPFPSDIESAIKKALNLDRGIEAIKVLRDKTGLSLEASQELYSLAFCKIIKH